MAEGVGGRGEGESSGTPSVPGPPLDEHPVGRTVYPVFDPPPLRNPLGPALLFPPPTGSKDSQIYGQREEGKCRPKLIRTRAWQFVCLLSDPLRTPLHPAPHTHLELAPLFSLPISCERDRLTSQGGTERRERSLLPERRETPRGG